MKRFCLFFVLFFLLQGQTKLPKVVFLKEFYGPLNEKPKKGSVTLTTLSCGHPLKLTSEVKEKGDTWVRVKAGIHEGYIRKRFTSRSRPQCFQDQYLRFFEKLELSVTNFYFWAKLYDNYIINTSGFREK